MGWRKPCGSFEEIICREGIDYSVLRFEHGSAISHAKKFIPASIVLLL